MQMRYGLGRFGVVTGIMCIVLVASSGLAAAQRRTSNVTRILMSPNAAGGSRIGLSIEDVTEDDAVNEGAAVRDVLPDSPAESAGFVDGDVVVEFDGERVRSARQLTRLVQETPAGRTVGTAVMRDGRRVELDVTPESGAIAAVPSLEILGERLGNVYSRIAPEVGRNFHLRRLDQTGDSPAWCQRARAFIAARRLLRGSTTSTTSDVVSRWSTPAKRCRSA